MNHSTIGRLAAVVFVASAGSALAADVYQFSPSGVPFTATGNVTLMTTTGSTACSAILSGATTSPAQITSATFSGGTGCSSVRAMNLPWKFVAHSSTRALLHHVTISVPGYGRCGPNEVNAVVSGGSITIQDHLPSPGGICGIDASLSTAPSLSITP